MIDLASNLVGYNSPAYAESLSEFGEPVWLPNAGGYLLVREIPGTSYVDAMGCYPLFFCEDWSALAWDLDNLPDEVVSVSLVADPFGSYDPHSLGRCFDVVNPFKKHYIVDLERSLEEIGSRSHRKQARRSLRDVTVEVCKHPIGFVEEWSQLYRTLQQKYNIQGVRGFSSRAFAAQLSMREIVVLQAFYNHELVGAQLYFQQEEVVHCHLGAVNDLGYSVGAFYAMDYYSYKYFYKKASKLDLGGGVGLSGCCDDGLSRYKSAWCAEARPV